MTGWWSKEPVFGVMLPSQQAGGGHRFDVGGGQQSQLK